MDVYHEMREIGIPVEIAATLEPELKKLSYRKQMAFLYWASGMSIRAVYKHSGVRKDAMKRIISKLSATLRG